VKLISSIRPAYAVTPGCPEEGSPDGPSVWGRTSHPMGALSADRRRRAWNRSEDGAVPLDVIASGPAVEPGER